MLEIGFRELLGFGRGNRGAFCAYLGWFMPQAIEGAMAGSKKLRMGAMLDHLLHRCHVVNIQGSSYRMREYRSRYKAGRSCEKCDILSCQK